MNNLPNFSLNPGRHGFGTIIGLGQQFDKLNAPRQKAFKAHITINDIHFGIVARNFMFYLLLDELMADYLDPITRVEIQASLFYMYAGWIVPTYVHKRWVYHHLCLLSNVKNRTDSSSSARTLKIA